MTAVFDKDKCKQRNRLAAVRDGVNAAPVRLYRQLPDPAELQNEGLRYAHGTLPQSVEEALDRINSTRGSDASPLTPDDIYVLYAEAANNNFVEDRYWFLDGTTLRNIARNAADGVAFMNSHRTGGMSHPSELPFGRTFAGRYEEYKPDANGKVVQRALVGLYMPRNVRPNGDSGPSSDDLYRMITSGTLFDVSVGLGGGMIMCDVCAREVESEDCNHLAGTTRNMNSDQQEAQVARGVKGGKASYTLVDATMGEVSAVYDGAVPGAGFRKALRFARQHKLNLDDLAQARQVYADLLSTGDMDMEEVETMVENGIVRAFRKVFGRDDAPPPPDEPEDEGDAVPPPTEPAPPAATATMLAQQAELQRLQAQVATMSAERVVERATALVDGLITASKLYPYERAGAIALFKQAMQDDERDSTLVTFSDGEGQEHKVTRTALLEAQYKARPAHNLTEEAVVAFTLPTGGAPSKDEKVQAEVKAAMQATPEGRAAWAKHEARNGTK